MQLSSLHKPLILLDLFNTSCPAISEHLQNMNALLKAYSDNVAMIAATTYNKAAITQFLQSHNLNGLAVPVVAGDSSLYDLFPYRIMPQVVWLDSNLNVLAVTFEYDVNATNIEGTLNHRLPLLRQKQDNLGFNLARFSFLADSIITAASILTGYHPELPATGDATRGPGYQRLLIINETIIGLYRSALHFWQPSNRILIRSSNKDLFEESAGTQNEGDWNAGHLFCYEAKIPGACHCTPETVMLHDLNRALNVTAGLKAVVTPCYVLIRTDKAKTFTTKGGKPMTNFISGNLTQKWMHNLPLSSLLSFLNEIPGMPPCLDETGYAGKADLLLNNDLSNMPSLKQALQQYGLDLIFTTRTVQMLVIEDNPPSGDEGEH